MGIIISRTDMPTLPKTCAYCELRLVDELCMARSSVELNFKERPEDCPLLDVDDLYFAFKTSVPKKKEN